MKFLDHHQSYFVYTPIYFYRFYFDEAQGSKISCPIDFPLSDLKVDIMTCPNISKSPRSYDLYGIVNHTGSKFDFRLIQCTVDNSETSIIYGAVIVSLIVHFSCLLLSINSNYHYDNFLLKVNSYIWTFDL